MLNSQDWLSLSLALSAIPGNFYKPELLFPRTSFQARSEFRRGEEALFSGRELFPVYS